MKQVKSNKSKAWRKTYGKPFIKRKAFCIAQMAVNDAISVQGAISSLNGFASVALSAAKSIQCMVRAAKAMNDQAHEMNKGFVTK